MFFARPLIGHDPLKGMIPTVHQGVCVKRGSTVVEGPPTQDQLRSILSYVAPEGRTAAGSVFLSAHPAAEPEKPADVEAIPKLASQHPNALKWPIVVDWAGGRASVGNVDGVKAMLEELRKVRDGEVPPPEEYKPKGWFS